MFLACVYFNLCVLTQYFIPGCYRPTVLGVKPKYIGHLHVDEVFSAFGASHDGRFYVY